MFSAADKSLFKRTLNNEQHVLQPLTKLTVGLDTICVPVDIADN